MIKGCVWCCVFECDLRVAFGWCRGCCLCGVGFAWLIVRISGLCLFALDGYGALALVVCYVWCCF